MSLRVLNVAYPLAPVGPDAVGGAEQVLAMLDAALVREGHESIVLACEGSRVCGELVTTGPLPAAFDAGARAAAVERQRYALAEVLRTRAIDVVHMHGLDFAEYLPESGPPVVITLHLPLGWYAEAALDTEREDVRLVCVSDSQRAERPDLAPDLIAIENGVALETYAVRGRKREYALALGRICPEKGQHHALDAAQRAGMALLIGGRAFEYPEHRAYLREMIEPRLDRRRRLLGALSLARKRRLLAAARCLLVTSSVRETSSLVAMEALASGTPVIAFRAGALPDLIEHGRTGFIVEDAEQMADAIARAGALRPLDCRAAAEQRFSARSMTRRYFELYAELAPSRLRAKQRRAPITLEAISAVSGLEAIADEWIELWQHAPHATVFQRPEWIVAWCHAFQPGPLHALALREGGRLVGLAPCYVREHNRKRTLALLGSGVSDYLDVVLDPSSSRAAVRALLGFIADDDAVDVCAFENLRAGSVLLHASAPRGFGDRVELDQVAPALALPAQSADWAAALPRRMRTNLQRAWNRARRSGVERDLEQVDPRARLEDFFRLHAACWRARGEAGVLADPVVQGFHRAVVAAFSASDMLAFHALKRDRQAVALVYALRDRRCERLYLSGFDPELERCSAGTLAVHHAIDRAAARGAHEVDFLRGPEPYKYAWGASDRALYRRTLVAPTLSKLCVELGALPRW